VAVRGAAREVGDTVPAMHHHVLWDGSFVLQDAFGITRVDREGRAKTLATAVWTTWSRLAPLGDPPSVLARVGPRRALRRIDLAALTHAPHREDLFALAASERETVRWDARVVPHTHERLRPRVWVNSGILHPATASLGPSLGADGTVAGITPGVDDPELTLVDPTPDGFFPRWRVPLRAGSDTVLIAHRTGAGVTLVGWRPRVGDATIITFDEAGAPSAPRTVQCLAAPAVDEGRVLVQPDPAHVTSLDLGTGEARTFTLTDPALHGPGVVVAGRGRSLFVPWRAEEVLDLDRERVIARKLPPSQRAQRAALTRWIVDHAARRLNAGMVLAMQVRLGARPRVMFWEPLAKSIDLVQATHRALHAALTTSDA
jgi:hypothetical protein